MTPARACDPAYDGGMGLALEQAARALEDRRRAGRCRGASTAAACRRAAAATGGRRDGDPTAHAEVRGAARGGAGARAVAAGRLHARRDAGAVPDVRRRLVLARVDRLVFGAWDPKAGAAGSVWDVVRDRRLNHRVEVVAGVRAAECARCFGFLRAVARVAAPPLAGGPIGRLG